MASVFMGESSVCFSQGDKIPEGSVGGNTGPHPSVSLPEAPHPAAIVLELSYHSKNITY